MKKYELLIRTMHAAQTARERGLENTADAFDDIVKRLSLLIDNENQSGGATKFETATQKLPQRLTTRKSY